MSMSESGRETVGHQSIVNTLAVENRLFVYISIRNYNQGFEG